MSSTSNAPLRPPDSPHVLVTGAAGLIATGIIPSLRREYRLRLTDKANATGREGDPYIQADLLDYASIPSLLEGIDAIIHLVIASVRELDGSLNPQSDEIPRYDGMMLDANIKATAHVFDAARRAGIKKIVYMSSLTVYFGDKSLSCYRETDPINPQNLYACTKLFGENLARVYAREYGISVLCLRVGQPYPSHTWHDDAWQTNAKARSSCVAMEDIAFAVRQALAASPSFGIYNIVSASDNPRFDITAAREIGYVPQAHFSASGIRISEQGFAPEPPTS